MFNIGLSEIFLIALVSIVVLDKNKIPVFIDLVRNIYRYFMIVKLRARKLLKDAGIEDLYKDYSVRNINYIFGKDSKFYSSYNIDITSKENDSKNSGSR